MTALSEALTAAQRRAIAALEKAYLAGKIGKQEAEGYCDDFGATDAVDRDRLFAALDTIATLGAEAPAEPTNGEQAVKPASDAQRRLIAKLCDERGIIAPDLAALAAEQASKLIDDVKHGTYDANEWEIPF